jgi:hypothetical protein
LEAQLAAAAEHEAAIQALRSRLEAEHETAIQALCTRLETQHAAALAAAELGGESAYENALQAVREAAAAANERNPPKKKKKTSETKTRKASKPTLEDDSSGPSQRLNVRGAKSSFQVLATRSSRRATPFDVTGRRQIAYDSLIRKASIQERSTRSAEMWEQALLIAHSEMQDYLNAVGAAGED